MIKVNKNNLVKEIGNHSELLDKKGLYSKLYKLQYAGQ